MECKFCEKEITQDRYNLGIYWERQDFPNESDWQKSSLHPQENVCGNCFDKITDNFNSFIQHFKAYKGLI